MTVDGWKPITLLAVFLVFVFPFFGLVSKAAKMFKPTLVLFTVLSLIGMWLVRYLEVYPSLYGVTDHAPLGIWEIGVTLLYAGLWGISYLAFMNAFPRMRVTLQTSPHRDEVQVPVDVPVNACGNSVDIVGLGNAAFGNECANGEEPATPPEGQPDVPSSEDPEELPPTAEQDPAPEPVAEEGTPDEGTGDQLAETGTGLPVGAVAPLGAGLLLGGVVLYRRAHARHG